jgi:hypothetical protein
VTGRPGETIVYRSAVDPWLRFVLAVAMLTSATASGVVFLAGDAWASAIALLAGGVGIGLPLWILTSTTYTFANEHLDVRSGPWRRRIPIASIHEVSPSTSPLSAPALSLNRLRIAYADRRTVMVSPRNASAFIDDLNRRRGAQSGADGHRRAADPAGGRMAP